MSFDFGLLRAGLTRPLEPINSFIDKLNQGMASPIRSLNKRLLGLSTPYARRNILEKMNSVADPVVSCDWIGVFNGPPGSDLDPIYIQGVTTPNESIGALEQLVNGIQYKTAGRVSCGDFTVSLYNDSDAISYTWTRMWWSAIKRSDRFYSLPVTYQRDFTVFILDPTRATVFDLTFTNCWLNNPSSFQLNGESNLMPIELSLSCDEVLVSADNDLSSIAFRLGSLIPKIPTVRGASSY